jgi:hyperosmotically inducible protein
MRLRFLVSALLLAMLGSSAAAQPSTLQVFRSVQRQVLTYSHFTIFDSVHAKIDNGEVTLLGKVTMPFKRDELEKRVSKVRGVTKVNNRIEVLPASKSDDELRNAIANAIYGNPTFAIYATQVNPPIHIVVERGRVTLEGVVANDLDRTVAYSIASSFPAFAVKNDLKTDVEVKAELEQL